MAQLVKNLPAMWETWVGKIPWRRERLPLQYSGLENSMDCIVHGVPKSWTQLSDFHFSLSLGKTLSLSQLESGLIPKLRRKE